MFGRGPRDTRDEPAYMSQSHEDLPPVTTEVHDNSWSANLETPAHAADPDAVVEQAIDAVEMTTVGNHVNLVSHADHGHPETYLFDALADAFGETISTEYVQQCGCGGHVTRVHREA
jgi:putative CGCGG family rSAM target protein